MKREANKAHAIWVMCRPSFHLSRSRSNLDVWLGLISSFWIMYYNNLFKVNCVKYSILLYIVLFMSIWPINTNQTYRDRPRWTLIHLNHRAAYIRPPPDSLMTRSKITKRGKHVYPSFIFYPCELRLKTHFLFDITSIFSDFI